MIRARKESTGRTGSFVSISVISSGGSKNWPTPVGDQLTTIDDLWHAAVNGHGQYFSAKNPDLLVSGLNTALAGVSARISSGAAAATSNLEPVAGEEVTDLAHDGAGDPDIGNPPGDFGPSEQQAHPARR